MKTVINDVWTYSSYNKKTNLWERININYEVHLTNGKVNRIFTQFPQPKGYLAQVSPTSEVFAHFASKHNSKVTN